MRLRRNVGAGSIWTSGANVGHLHIAARQPLPIVLWSMRPGWLLGVAIWIVACSTTPVPSSSAKPVPADRIRAPDFIRAEEGLALVVVTRDKSLTAIACTAHLHVDGTLVADLRPSEQIRLFLEAGQHLVGVSTAGCLGGVDQTSIYVTRARPVLLRIAAGPTRGLTIQLSAF